MTLPPILRDLFRQDEPVAVEARTVGELVAALDERLPGVRPRLCGEDGRLRPFLTVVADGAPLARAPETTLPAAADGEALNVWFLAAVAGG